MTYLATACHRLLIPFMPDLCTRVPLYQGPDMGRSPLPSVAWRPTSRKRPLSSWGSSPEFVWKTTSNNCFRFQQEYLVKQFLPYKDWRRSQASSVPLTPRLSQPACSHAPLRVDSIHLLRGTYPGPDFCLLSCVCLSLASIPSISTMAGNVMFHHCWTISRFGLYIGGPLHTQAKKRTNEWIPYLDFSFRERKV